MTPYCGVPSTTDVTAHLQSACNFQAAKENFAPRAMGERQRRGRGGEPSAVCRRGSSQFSYWKVASRRYCPTPAFSLQFPGAAKENFALEAARERQTASGYPRVATRRPSGVSLQISQSGFSGLENQGSAQPRSTQVLTVRGLTRWPLRSKSGSLPPGWSRPRASQARCAAFGGPDGGAPTSFNAPRFMVPLVMPHPSWLTAFPGNATAMLCLADPRAKPAATMQARQGSSAGSRRRLP